MRKPEKYLFCSDRSHFRYIAETMESLSQKVWLPGIINNIFVYDIRYFHDPAYTLSAMQFIKFLQGGWKPLKNN